MCGAGTAVEEPGVLPELVHLDSFPDVWLLFCEMGGGVKLREAVWCQNVILYYHVEFVVCCSDWVSVNFPVVVEPVEPFYLVFPHHSVKWQDETPE